MDEKPLAHLAGVEQDVQARADDPFTLTAEPYVPAVREDMATSGRFAFRPDARIQAFHFDGTLEGAGEAALWGGSSIITRVKNNYPTMPDVVTLHVEQGCGPLVCYGGQWLLQLGKKFAVMDGDDADGYLVNDI